MPLEVGTVINDLTQTNPTISDPVGQGDDHLRLIKTCLQGSLPQMGGILGQVRSQDTNTTVPAINNTSAYVVTNSATATVVLTMPANASITTGWSIDVFTRSGANAVITPASGSINGSATFAVPPFSMARVMYAGSNVWYAAYGQTGEGTATTDNLYVRGTLSVSGGATLASGLSVSGNAHFTSGVSIGGAATLGGAVTISGAATLLGTLSVSGGATLASTLSVSGAVSLATTLSVSGAATLKTTLSIGGATSIGGAVNLLSTLNVAGATTLSGAVTMKGIMSVSGIATFGSAVTISGAAVLGSTLNVSGATTLGNTLAVTGNTALNGTLSISGVTTLSGGQLVFPASQNASAGANTLDDYEEGTFTPTLTFATPGDLSVTYGARIGLYTKIGDMMMVTIRVATTAWTHSTASGALRITGLPAAALSTVGSIIGVQVAEFSGIAVTAGRTQVSGQIAAAATLLDFTTLSLTTGGAFNVAPSEAASGSAPTVILTITYKTST